MLVLSTWWRNSPKRLRRSDSFAKWLRQAQYIFTKILEGYGHRTLFSWSTNSTISGLYMIEMNRRWTMMESLHFFFTFNFSKNILLLYCQLTFLRWPIHWNSCIVSGFGRWNCSCENVAQMGGWGRVQNLFWQRRWSLCAWLAFFSSRLCVYAETRWKFSGRECFISWDEPLTTTKCIAVSIVVTYRVSEADQFTTSFMESGLVSMVVAKWSNTFCHLKTVNQKWMYYSAG